MTDLAAVYLKALDSSPRASTTKSRYRRTVELHVIPAMGEFRLRELSTGKFTQAITKMAEQSPSEAKIMRAVCTAMMACALQHDSVTTNHAIQSAVNLKNPNRKMPRALTPADAVRLFGLIDDAMSAARPGPVVRKGMVDLSDALRLGLASGLRISELTAIRTQDISWSDPVTVRIHQANVYQEGTGKKIGPRQREFPGGQFIQPHTKTNDVRQITFDEFGADILRRRCEDVGEDGLIFWSQGTRGPVSINSMRKALRRIIGDTDLDFVSTHTMRRSLATAVNVAYGLNVTKDLLNHREESTTRRSYIEELRVGPDVTDVSRTFGGRAR